jgi:hypothetical protein
MGKISMMVLLCVLYDSKPYHDIHNKEMPKIISYDTQLQQLKIGDAFIKSLWLHFMEL